MPRPSPKAPRKFRFPYIDPKGGPDRREHHALKQFLAKQERKSKS